MLAKSNYAHGHRNLCFHGGNGRKMYTEEMSYWYSLARCHLASTANDWITTARYQNLLAVLSLAADAEPLPEKLKTGGCYKTYERVNSLLTVVRGGEVG